MSPLEPLDWKAMLPPRALPTEDEIFERWIAFGDGWTLDEFTLAYLATIRL